MTLLYLVVFARNRIETDDGFRFAHQVETAPWSVLFDGDNVRHLLFLPLSKLLHEVVTWAGADVRAYDLMRVTSSVVAGAAVPLLGVLLEKRLGLSRFAAFASAAGFGASYGFWRYANEAEVYSYSALVVLALLWLSLDRRLTPLRVIGIGALGARPVRPRASTTTNGAVSHCLRSTRARSPFSSGGPTSLHTSSSVRLTEATWIMS